MNENKNECHAERDGWCPFMEKPCDDVEHEVCEALIKAYEQGFDYGYC